MFLFRLWEDLEKDTTNLIGRGMDKQKHLSIKVMTFVIRVM